jgi:hypothetical protein
VHACVIIIKWPGPAWNVQSHTSLVPPWFHVL